MNETERATDEQVDVLERMARPARGKPLHVFCSGVGGTGLSGLARLLVSLGHHVCGSDRSASATLEGLAARGVEVFVGQKAENLAGELDLFVATAALPADHPELVEAQARGLTVVKYAEALGALVAERRGIAVAGTHGKTTTTSLLAHVLQSCGRSPSFVIGGVPKTLSASAQLGEGPDLVFEACEYDRSFRHYRPALAALLNVEVDHLDCYEGLDSIVEAFSHFASRVRDGGNLIVNGDCAASLRVAARVRELRPDVRIDRVSLRGAEAEVEARGLRYEDGCARFELAVEGELRAEVRLSVPGPHNASNALIAIACALRSGVSPEAAAAAVEGFTGVRRRYDLLAKGDVVVVDDYAHHPTAIDVVLRATRSRYPDRRVVVCFEPHQASRTRHLFDDFVAALSGADEVLLADIYLCRDGEEDARSVSSGDLAAAIRARSPETEARHVGDLASLGVAARATLRPGDVALFLGAGRVTHVAHEVAEQRAALQAPRSQPSLRLHLPDRLERSLRRELGEALRLDVDTAPHSTLKTGGRARFCVEPQSVEEAIAAQRAFLRHGVPVVPLGGGSNTLFCADRLDGALLLTRRLRGSSVAGTRLRASCGTTLGGAIRLAERHGLAGLEHFSAIPGTLGGAVFGNAGGPRDAGTVGDLVCRVRVVEPDGRVRWRSRADLGLRYRGSELSGCLVLDVELELKRDSSERLRAVRLEATRRKAACQPLGARSLGCTFRNPAGGSAGLLIDQLGLKGLRRGGAEVSPVHGNFIVNTGDATPADVLELLAEVRARVQAARGIELTTELRLIA